MLSEIYIPFAFGLNIISMLMINIHGHENYCKKKHFEHILWLLERVHALTEHLLLTGSPLICINPDLKNWFRTPDKSVYCKTIFFISHPKHMLWVLKRTVSMRRFF